MSKNIFPDGTALISITDANDVPVALENEPDYLLRVAFNDIDNDVFADELLDNPYLYVRFYLSGDNGICYSQPMVLNVEGEEFAPVVVPETHDISTFLRAFVTVVDQFFFKFNPLIWIFKYFGLGYNPIERL